MIISGTHFPAAGDWSKSTALAPIAPVYAADDAPPESRQPRSRHPQANDLSRLERIQYRLYGRRILHDRPLDVRARQAVLAYGAVKSFEDKEYIRAVMGVDEFA